jgi:hypothetical protein
VNLADDLLLPTRDQLRHDGAEHEEADDGLEDRDQPDDAQWDDVAEPDGCCGHEAEIQRGHQSMRAAADRAGAFAQSAHGGRGNDPVEGRAPRNRAEPQKNEISGRAALEKIDERVAALFSGGYGPVRRATGW